MYATVGSLDGFSGCRSDLANNLISSDLDTYGGQSGSGIWTTEDATIRAIHVAGGETAPYHRVISQWVFDNVYEEISAAPASSQ